MKRWLLLLVLLAGAAQAIAPDKLLLGKEPVVDQAAAVVILDQALETERTTNAPAGELVPPTRRG